MKPLGQEASTDKEAISLSFLQDHQDDFVDREVTVATYLFTHEDGPWIGDDLKNPLVDTMSLKITEQSKVSGMPSTTFRCWYEYQEGYPVILSGVFRVGRWKIGHERYKENHPYIEVSRALEVPIDDADWNSRVTEGEQDAPSNGG